MACVSPPRRSISAPTSRPPSCRPTETCRYTEDVFKLSFWHKLYAGGVVTQDVWRSRPAAGSESSGSAERSPKLARTSKLNGREADLARSPLSSPQVSPSQNRKAALMEAGAVAAGGGSPTIGVTTAGTVKSKEHLPVAWGACALASGQSPHFLALSPSALAEALEPEEVPFAQRSALSALLERSLCADEEACVQLGEALLDAFPPPHGSASGALPAHGKDHAPAATATVRGERGHPRSLHFGRGGGANGRAAPGMLRVRDAAPVSGKLQPSSQSQELCYNALRSSPVAAPRSAPLCRGMQAHRVSSPAQPRTVALPGAESDPRTLAVQGVGGGPPSAGDASRLAAVPTANHELVPQLIRLLSPSLAESAVDITARPLTQGHSHKAFATVQRAAALCVLRGVACDAGCAAAVCAADGGVEVLCALAMDGKGLGGAEGGAMPFGGAAVLPHPACMLHPALTSGGKVPSLPSRIRMTPAAVLRALSCRVLFALSTHESITAPLVGRPGAMDALVRLVLAADLAPGLGLLLDADHMGNAGSERHDDATTASLAVLAQVATRPEARLALSAAAPLEALLSLVQSPSGAVGEKAGWLMCLVASDPVPATRLLAHPAGLQALVAHGVRGALQAKEEAAWAFATLSAEGDHSCQLAGRVDVVTLLLCLAQEPAQVVALQAIWAIANLTLLPTARTTILELQPFGTLLQLLPPATAAPTTTEMGAAAVAAGTMAAGTVAAGTAAAGTAAAAYDPSTTRQAVRAIGALLHEESARSQLLACPYGIARLVELASSASGNLLDLCVRALSHACNFPTSAAADVLAHPSSQPLLLAKLTSAEGTPLHEVVGLVANLAYAAAEDPADVDASFFVPLVVPLVGVVSSRTSDERAQANAAAALCSLSSIMACRARIIEAGALLALSSAAEISPSAGVRTASQRALDAVTSLLTPNSRRALLGEGGTQGGMPASHPSCKVRSGLASPLSRGSGGAGSSRHRRGGVWRSPLGLPPPTDGGVPRSPLGIPALTGGAGACRRVVSDQALSSWTAGPHKAPAAAAVPTASAGLALASDAAGETQAAQAAPHSVPPMASPSSVAIDEPLNDMLRDSQS